MEILNIVKPFRNGDYVFPGRKKNTGLSNMALEAVLRRMDLKDRATVHGFRSSFRDWAAEETEHAREIAEISLAHIVGDATERAYRRGDILDKRRILMSDWENHCNIAGV
jgi:integrase